MSLNHNSTRFQLIKQNEAIIRHINDTKSVHNYITNEFSPNVSLSVTKADECNIAETTQYDRIYFFLEGRMILNIEGQEFVLRANDSIFIEAGMSYDIKGTFRSVVVNQPAFGNR